MYDDGWRGKKKKKERGKRAEEEENHREKLMKGVMTALVRWGYLGYL